MLQDPVGRTVPFVFSADEPAAVSKDQLSQVVFDEFADYNDSKFTGFVKEVVVNTGEDAVFAH